MQKGSYINGLPVHNLWITPAAERAIKLSQK
jgi:hypothetical protein